MKRCAREVCGLQCEALRGKLVYVARAGAKAVSEKTPEADLLVGEVPPAALEGFQMLLAEVFVPLLAEQAPWGRATDAQAHALLEVPRTPHPARGSPRVGTQLQCCQADPQMPPHTDHVCRQLAGTAARSAGQMHGTRCKVPHRGPEFPQVVLAMRHASFACLPAQTAARTAEALGEAAARARGSAELALPDAALVDAADGLSRGAGGSRTAADSGAGAQAGELLAAWCAIAEALLAEAQASRGEARPHLAAPSLRLAQLQRSLDAECYAGLRCPCVVALSEARRTCSGLYYRGCQEAPPTVRPNSGQKHCSSLSAHRPARRGPRWRRPGGGAARRAWPA